MLSLDFESVWDIAYVPAGPMLQPHGSAELRVIVQPLVDTVESKQLRAKPLDVNHMCIWNSKGPTVYVVGGLNCDSYSSVQCWEH